MAGIVIKGDDPCPECGHRYYFHHSALFKNSGVRGCRVRIGRGPTGDWCRCTAHEGKRMMRLRTHRAYAVRGV